MPITPGNVGLFGSVPAWRLPIEPLHTEPARRSHPLNRDRLAWWLALPGKSGGPQWLDVMGLRPATLGNAPAATPRWVTSSRPGGTAALDFGGSQLCDAGTSAAFALSRSFAIAAWVRPTTIGPTMGIISRGAGGFYLRVDTACKIDWLASQTADIVGGATALVAASWAHVAATVDATGNVRLFVNGKLDGAATSTQTYAGSRLLIGTETGSGSQWVGQMDDVSVWGRQLSDGEVGQLYSESARGYPETLRGTRGSFLAAAAATATAVGATGTGSITMAGGGVIGTSAVGSGSITVAGGGSASGTVAVGSIIPIIMVTYRRRRSG